MDRRSFIGRVGIAGVAATIAAPAVHAQTTVRWRLAHSFPKSLDTIFGTAETFAKLVSDMSGGKFVITVFQPGEIVPALSTLDAVQNGTIECSHTASNFYAGKDETSPSTAFRSASTRARCRPGCSKPVNRTSSDKIRDEGADRR